jgi:hypothetical protein
MAIISRQIGWGTESNLLYQILKQLNRLTSIMFGLKPKYKVYTALLTQGGGDDPQSLSSGPVTKGVTYYITDASDGDFTNVGAPNNDEYTYFVAINDEVPNNYGSALLAFNTGAPVVTVLENTIGNIWFSYIVVGEYRASSDTLFTLGKSWNMPAIFLLGSDVYAGSMINGDENRYAIFTTVNTIPTDNILENTPIEIRVYN